MPGFDGTGPLGLGPMTGRGMGFCVLPMAGRPAPNAPGLYPRPVAAGRHGGAYAWPWGWPYGGGIGRVGCFGRGPRRGFGRGRGRGRWWRAW